LVILLGAQVIAARASAQPAPASPAASSPVASASATAQAGPSQNERDRARALMDVGDEKAAKGDLSAALAAYESAHAIMRVPTTGIEVAKMLDKLGKPGAALVAARDVLAIPVASGEPKPFTEAREKARKLAAALESRVPTLTVNVTGAPAGAS